MISVDRIKEFQNTRIIMQYLYSSVDKAVIDLARGGCWVWCLNVTPGLKRCLSSCRCAVFCLQTSSASRSCRRRAALRSWSNSSTSFSLVLTNWLQWVSHRDPTKPSHVTSWLGGTPCVLECRVCTQACDCEETLPERYEELLQYAILLSTSFFH